MRKGDMVKFNPRQLNHINKLRGYINASRPLTADEIQAWYNSPAAQGPDESGETKLPPTFRMTRIPIDSVMIVERARCQLKTAFMHKPIPGMTRVVTPECEVAYVERRLLEIVAE